jgi:hypothetical protein
MDFKTWLEDNKLLATTYRDSMKVLPQDPKWHPEGNVLNHVKLVRKSVLNAVKELNNLKQNNTEAAEVLQDVDFNISSEEQRILNLSAWLHDIGKITATKVIAPPDPKAGKITSKGHENPKHYGPQIERFKQIAPKEMVDFYERHKDLINFLIERHMDFTRDLSKSFFTSYFANGRLKNDKKLKLLMILMWADKMGRAGSYDLQSNVDKLIEASRKNKEHEQKSARQNKPFEGSVEDFKNLLRARGLPDDQVEKAAIAKFGFQEAKDACYTKVKSRYSTWPSAYASGSLVRCRKVGAKNWGNKKEQVEINESKFKLEKERGLKGWFDRNQGKGWIDCKKSKKGSLVPCGRKKTGKGAEREYPACRPTLSACNKKGTKRKKNSKRISWE